MVYTILGGLIGGTVSFMLCRLFGVSQNSGVYAVPSKTEVFIFFGTIIGLGVGFGYGTGHLLAGTHIIQQL